MGAMWGLVGRAVVLGLTGRFAGTCCHIALVQSLRRVVPLLYRSIGHSGRGSSAGFGGVRLVEMLSASNGKIAAQPMTRLFSLDLCNTVFAYSAMFKAGQ
jgi:hypothetical protein